MSTLSSWEVTGYRVTKSAMQDDRRSWFLSYDPFFMADSGCLGRLVIIGFAVEVYRPLTGSRVSLALELMRGIAERIDNAARSARA